MSRIELGLYAGIVFAIAMIAGIATAHPATTPAQVGLPVVYGYDANLDGLVDHEAPGQLSHDGTNWVVIFHYADPLGNVATSAAIANQGTIGAAGVWWPLR